MYKLGHPATNPWIQPKKGKQPDALMYCTRLNETFQKQQMLELGSVRHAVNHCIRIGEDSLGYFSHNHVHTRLAEK